MNSRTGLPKAPTDAPAKVEVILPMHPRDNARAVEAAEMSGMSFAEFCGLAIHLQVVEIWRRLS